MTVAVSRMPVIFLFKYRNGFEYDYILVMH